MQKEIVERAKLLDDGKEIILKDVLGFAEKVHNKW